MRTTVSTYLLRRRSLAAASAATMLFAGLSLGAAVPAHSATFDYYCGTGSYKSGLMRLGAFDCTGSGTTNVTVEVDVLSNNDSAASFTCATFGLSGVPGHWAGTGCS